MKAFYFLIALLVSLAYGALPGPPARARAQERPAIVGVSHIALKTDNLAAAREFYGRILGYGNPTSASGKDGKPLAVYFDVNAHQYIELLPELESPGADRLSHIAFETTDVRALRDYFSSCGVAIFHDLHAERPGTLTFGVKDPEGHSVEFVQFVGGPGPAQASAQPSPDNRISLRIIHVGHIVRDRSAEDAFYRDILGFREIWHGGRTDDRTDWVDMRVPEGKDWLEYMLNVQNPSPHALGVMHHLALGVPSVDASYRIVIDRGLKADTPRIGRDGKWQLNLYDPNDTRVELMEPKPVRPPCCSPILEDPPRSAPTDQPEVRLMRTPDSGIQPQGVLDRKGVLHLIYFKGDPAGGDIYYVRRDTGRNGFSQPIRVNSQPGSAIAIGAVRGPQVALGRQGRVHVVWMGSKTAEPRGPEGATPILFSRLNDRVTAFEPQRNVMQFAVGADGGVSVAADRSGYVYVTWHGRGDTPGEANRRVWVARSKDEGESFEREVAANGEPTGACGCCGMRAFADRQGGVYILYRAATGGVERDMVLLVSRDHGKSFEATRVQRWHLNACPMTTAAIVRGANDIEVAWETAGQVYYGRLDSDSLRVTPVVAAPGEGNGRKHPALAEDAQGDTLLAWTEGTGWNKGGSLAWQVFDRSGNPMDVKGHADGVPVWGLPAVFAVPGGQFTIIY